MSKQTINTIPTAGASFLTDLDNFLTEETPDYARYYLSDKVVSGGIGATDATLAHTISAVTAFPNNHYVYQAATSHTYTASKRTFVYVRDDNTRTVTIASAAVTYDDYLVFAEMAAASSEPEVPTGCAYLFYADTSAVAITSVTDRRIGGELYPITNYTDLSTALTTLGDINATLIITGRVSVADDLTIPSNISVEVKKGGMFILAAGKTLTIQGGFEAGPYQVFSGTGTADFSAALVEFVYVEWWYDGGGNYDSALEAAADTDVPNKLSIGTKPLTSAATLNSGYLYLTGSKDLTVIDCTGATAGLTFTRDGSEWNEYAQRTVRDLRIDGDWTQTGLQIKGSYCHLQDLSISRCLTGLKMTECYVHQLDNVHVYGDSSYAVETTGIYLDGIISCTIINPHLRYHKYALYIDEGSGASVDPINIKIVGGAIQGNVGGYAIYVPDNISLYELNLDLDGVYFELNGDHTNSIPSIYIPDTGDGEDISAAYDRATVTARGCTFTYNAGGNGTGDYEWGWKVNMNGCRVDGYHKATSMDIKDSYVYSNFAGEVTYAKLDGCYVGGRFNHAYTNPKEPTYLLGCRDTTFLNGASSNTGFMFQCEPTYSASELAGGDETSEPGYPQWLASDVNSPTIAEDADSDFGAGSWTKVTFQASAGAYNDNSAYVYNYHGTGKYRVNVLYLKADQQTDLYFVVTGARQTARVLHRFETGKTYKLILISNQESSEGENERLYIYPEADEGAEVKLFHQYQMAFTSQLSQSNWIDSIVRGR